MRQFYCLVLGFLVFMVRGATQQIPIHCSIDYTPQDPSRGLTVTWEAIPSKRYEIQMTTDLGQQPWQSMTTVPIFATNNLLRFREQPGEGTRFYKVVRLDTDAPTIWRLSPESGATAVPRQSSLKAYLRDETGIDPGSIALTVGTNPPVTLDDPRLVLAQGTLSFTPATHQFLGTNGETVQISLAVSDMLGHRATNHWQLELEWAPILASNVVIIGPESSLKLSSLTAETLVFQYAGSSSGLNPGKIVVSSDPSLAYKRRVLSMEDDPVTHTVRLNTEQAALGDILDEGSIRFMVVEFVAGGGIRRVEDTDGITIPLDGIKLYENDSTTVEVVSGRFFLDPDLSIGARFRRPRTFDLDISATMELDMALRAVWADKWEFEASQPVSSAWRSFRLLGFIPVGFLPIPVWAEAVAEFRVGVEGEVSGQATATGGFSYSRSVAVGARLRDGQWSTYERESSEFTVQPVSWQASGAARIQGYVEPKFTIYLESLVGPSLNLRPYLELEGKACVEPGKVGVDVSLYGGLLSTIALEARIWDEDWGSLPSRELFNLRELLWHETLATEVGPPPAPRPNLVWIPCGTFLMGSPTNEPARLSAEGPQTLVTLSEGFWMGRYEVTQQEYLEVMGTNPSVDPDDLERPVEVVGWDDAMAYCVALTAQERSAGRLPVGYEYTLPTEAQWEYACRAGTTTAFHYGPALRSGMANFHGYSEYPPCGGDPRRCPNPNSFETDKINRPVPVGSYAPNAWGLYDMHGNVQEWCLDWLGESLPGGHVMDLRGTNYLHAFRGGNWFILGGQGWQCRSAYRNVCGSGCSLQNDQGFRIVLVRVP